MKSSTTVYILIGIIVVLAAVIIGILLYLNSQPEPVRGIEPLVEIEPMEPDPEVW